MTNNLREEDIDPLSLTNLILRRDFRIGGSGLGWAKNWVKDERSVTPNEIMDDAAATFGTTDDIILEAVQKKKAKKKVAKKAKRRKRRQPQQAQEQQPQQPQGNQEPAQKGTPDNQEQGQEEAPPEQNQINPEMFSTEPELNPCAAFMNGICRVDGRPCLFTIQDYTECGKHNLALSTDPELMEIPPGREQSFEYQKGQHA